MLQLTQITINVCPHRTHTQICACIQPTCAPRLQQRLRILPHHLVRRSPLWPPAFIHRGALHYAATDRDRPSQANGAAHNKGAN